MRTVWLVGVYRGDDAPWEVGGIFTTEQMADDACTSRDHWLTEVPIDHVAPEATTPFPNPTRWPRKEQ